MKILYVALKESLPGSHGGAVHVLEVGRQLARRGHSVRTVVAQLPGQLEHEPLDGFELHRLRVPNKYLLFCAERAIRELIGQFKPDVVMERYYNFAGAGIAAARAFGIPSVLEVNAPMMNPPGTAKHRVDALTFGSLRRRALFQANAACRIVTPLAATVPASVPREKICEIPWGANVELFDPTRLDSKRVQALRDQLNPKQRRVVAFLGSFRLWHGVREFLRVARELAQTRSDILFLMIGAGELLDESRAFVREHRLGEQIVLTGAVRYEEVPCYLALADVGLAPFNTALHAPLRVGFYWSPLKVHEYMAMALPVITIDVHPLDQIVRHEREGLLYREGDLDELRAQILRLVDDAEWARQLGRAGRQRVVEQFSWQRHAERLERVLIECVGHGQEFG